MSVDFANGRPRPCNWIDYLVRITGRSERTIVWIAQRIEYMREQGWKTNGIRAAVRDLLNRETNQGDHA